MFAKEFLDDLAMVKTEYDKSYDFTISQSVKLAISAYNPLHPSLESAWNLCQAIADDAPMTSFGFIAYIQKKSKLIASVMLLKQINPHLELYRNYFAQMVQHKSLTWLHYFFKEIIPYGKKKRIQQDNVYLQLMLTAPCAQISSVLITLLLHFNCPAKANEHFELMWQHGVTKSGERYELNDVGDALANYIYTDMADALSMEQKHQEFVKRLTTIISENSMVFSHYRTESVRQIELVQATDLLVSRQLIQDNPSHDNMVQREIRRVIQIQSYEPAKFSPLMMAEAIVAFSELTLPFIFKIYARDRVSDSFFGHEYRCEIVKGGRTIYSAPAGRGLSDRQFSSSFERGMDYEGYVYLLMQAIGENRAKPKEFVTILSAMHKDGLLDRPERFKDFEILLFSNRVYSNLMKVMGCQEQDILTRMLDLTEEQLLNVLDDRRVQLTT